MAIEPRELPALLEERRQSDRVLDDWGSRRVRYHQWHRDLNEIFNVYAGNWDVVWPDHVRSRALPKVPNFVQIAADDRSRQITATKPSLVVRPEKPGDRSKQIADKKERILGGWWAHNRIQSRLVPRWAFDAMSGGLTACLTLPDFTKVPSERMPCFYRLEPAFSFPSPTFAEGPWVDDFLYVYEEKLRTVEAQYQVDLNVRRDGRYDPTKVRLLSYYDDKYYIVVAESIPINGNTKTQFTVLREEAHKLGKCPVTIGTRATMDGVYRGEFMGGLGILNYWNRMMTLMLDDAVSKVYAPKTYYDIENPEDYGPDALLEKQSPQGSFEYVQPPNQPFTNVQLMRDLNSSAASAMLMPPSRLGDPNESIISAAGISATQSQFVEDVRSIQRDILAPMMEAANEMAMRGEELYGGKRDKVVYGEARGQDYRETYNPSKDFGGVYRNSVVYGMGAGLDQINTNVMVLQQRGAGLLSKRSAMEQSPFTEDPQREEKQIAIETLDDATFAGLVAQAQQGALPATALAAIRKAVEDDKMSLHEAIMASVPQAPLAQPQSTVPGAAPTAPGLAGAATGGAGGTQGAAQQGLAAAQQVLPSLKDLGVRR